MTVNSQNSDDERKPDAKTGRQWMQERVKYSPAASPAGDTVTITTDSLRIDCIVCIGQ